MSFYNHINHDAWTFFFAVCWHRSGRATIKWMKYFSPKQEVKNIFFYITSWEIKKTRSPPLPTLPVYLPQESVQNWLLHIPAIITSSENLEVKPYQVTLCTKFFIFSPFFEKISQICPWRKDFKIWTLISAPSLLAPSLHCGFPAHVFQSKHPDTAARCFYTCSRFNVRNCFHYLFFFICVSMLLIFCWNLIV